MLSLDIRAHSEIGLVRKNNQDSAYASPNLLAVADGMGGAAAGDLASAVAITAIARADRRLDGEDMLSAFAGALDRANGNLARLIHADSSLEGMGTTVSGAMFSGTQLGLVHVGDSRAYLFRDGRLTRLTHDHSWVQSLVDEGRLNEADMATHPHRSLLLRVLNGQPMGDPDTALVDVAEGDRLLFCSDGLSGFTSDEKIAAVLRGNSLDDAVPKLIQLAHAGGGADNITFVLADVVAQSPALDAAEPLMLGAVTDADVAPVRSRGVPPVESSTGDADADDEDQDQPDRVMAPVDHERLRYQPGRQHHRWLPTIVLLASVLLALTVAGAVGVVYARSQFYVGATASPSGDRVAIFRGLPDSVVGVPLSKVEVVEDILVSDLPRYYRDQVHNTISADSLDSARATAHQLAVLAQTCIAQRAAQQQPSAPPSPSPIRSASASASRSASGSPTVDMSDRVPSPGATGSVSASALATTGNPSATPGLPSANATASTGVPGQQDCS